MGDPSKGMADARKDKRTLLSLKIRFKSSTLEDFIERYSGDISRGGVFIKAKKPLAVGTLLKFEFMLDDQSTLIHGVGRVVWRREPAESSEVNPPGMGIKFIKMDPKSRSVVERIADQRGDLGVFEHGKEGAPVRAAVEPELDDFDDDEPTNVRHVSEFLTSALREGGANEAHAALGAFSASKHPPSRPAAPISDGPSSGAISAFGGAPAVATANARTRVAVPALGSLDLEDEDFVDEQSTKVRDFPMSEFPDAAATVIAPDAAALLTEKRATPVVPAPSEPAGPDESIFELPDRPSTLQPAPGELIDDSLLDPWVSTVPPGSAPEPSASTPVEAFKAPPRPPKAAGIEFRATKKRRSALPALFLLFLLLLVGGGAAAWQLGLLDQVPGLEVIEGWLPRPVAPSVAAPVKVPQPEPVEQPTPAAPAAAEAATAETDVADSAGEEDPSDALEAPETALPGKAAAPSEPVDSGMVKLRIVSEPAGAFVSINGRRLGRTPVEVEYEVGTRLKLFSKLRGYLARRQGMTVQAAQTEVKLVLTPLTYVVRVVTDPPGAGVSAVGGGATTTPGELTFKSFPTSRKVVIAKDGYKTANATVKRSAFVEETSRMFASLRVKLEPEPGTQRATPAAPVEAPEPVAAPDEPPVEVEAEPAPELPAAAQPPAPSETSGADAP